MSKMIITTEAYDLRFGKNFTSNKRTFSSPEVAKKVTDVVKRLDKDLKGGDKNG